MSTAIDCRPIHTAVMTCTLLSTSCNLHPIAQPLWQLWPFNRVACISLPTIQFSGRVCGLMVWMRRRLRNPCHPENLNEWMTVQVDVKWIQHAYGYLTQQDDEEGAVHTETDWKGFLKKSDEKCAPTCLLSSFILSATDLEMESPRIWRCPEIFTPFESGHPTFLFWQKQKKSLRPRTNSDPKTEFS